MIRQERELYRVVSIKLNSTRNYIRQRIYSSDLKIRTNLLSFTGFRIAHVTLVIDNIVGRNNRKIASKRIYNKNGNEYRIAQMK